MSMSKSKSTSTATATNTCRLNGSRAWGNGSADSWWAQHREATLNWLALGMLLAAWNATDSETTPVVRRPETLRGYTYVSVRAAVHNFDQDQVTAPN